MTKKTDAEQVTKTDSGNRARMVSIAESAGAFLTVCMFVAYLPQIVNNLAGNPGNFLQPLVATINCICWSIYAFFREGRDWPLFVGNITGVVFGAVTFLTAIL